MDLLIRKASAHEAARLRDISIRTFEEAFAEDNSAEDMGVGKHNGRAVHFYGAAISSRRAQNSKRIFRCRKFLSQNS